MTKRAIVTDNQIGYYSPKLFANTQNEYYNL